jgi:predicted metal-dependent phosphotriesterase family hydrolase
MDRFGIDHFASFQQRCDLVVEMCRRGYADRDHGVAGDQLDAMLVRTPARILAGQAAG